MTRPDKDDREIALRDVLARGDAVLDAAAPILAHLLANDDNSLFSDEIIARVRGMMNHVAWQMLAAQALTAGHHDVSDFAEANAPELMESLCAESSLLRHCHALALEWQLTDRIARERSVDPVVSPLMQELIASENEAISSLAMTLLASQARFGQHQRRMELPLNELPGDLLHQALLRWRGRSGGVSDDAIAQSDRQLREEYDEGASRAGLLQRIVASMGKGARAALKIEHGGAALFLSSLAELSNQSRDVVALSTHERLSTRFALSLRAAGLSAREAGEQLLVIHPDARLPGAVVDLASGDAQELFARSADRSGH